jgi:hypothetical protein
MLRDPDIPNGEHAGQPLSPSALRSLEVGALLQAVTALHFEGLLSDAEFRAKRLRLAAPA